MDCPGSTIIGFPPTFAATASQDVTFSFYFNSGLNPVSTGSGTSATYTPGKKTLPGTYSVRVVVTNSNGSSEASCSWTVINPFTSEYITQYCCCTNDCTDPEDFKDISAGPCIVNAIMRWTRYDRSSAFSNILSRCKYIDPADPTHIKSFYDDTNWNLLVYYAAATIAGHDVCALDLGGDQNDINNWLIFQFGDLDIQLGDVNGQLPPPPYGYYIFIIYTITNVCCDSLGIHVYREPFKTWKYWADGEIEWVENSGSSEWYPPLAP